MEDQVTGSLVNLIVLLLCLCSYPFSLGILLRIAKKQGDDGDGYGRFWTIIFAIIPFISQFWLGLQTWLYIGRYFDEKYPDRHDDHVPH